MVWNLPELFMPVGFPCGTSGKESACQCRRGKRLGINPWVGKIPWKRGWQPTPVAMENPIDRGAWQATDHGVAKTQTRLKRLSTHTWVHAVTFSPLYFLLILLLKEMFVQVQAVQHYRKGPRSQPVFLIFMHSLLSTGLWSSPSSTSPCLSSLVTSHSSCLQ